ncbi:hypothetical protein L226DRAFT_587223 [Lentinus tigrinus ALCF2SS1-7]|uniref:uncharacterized protein n=1 Tax=Lentinus tigrinus ALCF2SS1-7 TaxID=1328758 RepID=UPI001165D538|nr:hypothetical protein L226DRAFT_587223 [Lentinus tigrinus ALCF2SS1-7]
MGLLAFRPWTHAPSRTGFLDLPIELQIMILCLLDPASLVACRLTSRWLSKVFESMAVQYAYRLGVSAMTDSSPEGVSLQDRYSAILQFQHTWAGSAFSPRIQDPQEGLRYLAQSNGVFVYAVENSHTLALKLHRPGNARTGLPELTFMCMAWKSLLEPTDLSGARYTVDLSQDLLVITLPGDARNDTQRVGTDTYPKDADRLEFHSDLVAWGNYQATWHGDDDHYWQISMEVQVMNWKTGVVVWDGIDVFSFDPDRATDKGRQVIRQSMVFLVSLATIRSYLARRETGWWRRSRAIVPWDNWGPTGARVVTAENTTAHKLSLAVHGSRCVLSIPTPVVFSPIEKMVVIDAHPYAQQCGSGVTRQTLQPEDRTVPPAPVVDSSDVKGFMKKKTIVLEGRFPCRMETYLSPRKAEYRGNHTVLTGEEVVVVIPAHSGSVAPKDPHRSTSMYTAASLNRSETLAQRPGLQSRQLRKPNGFVFSISS